MAQPPVDPIDQPDPGAVPPATWRQEIRGASGITFLVGLWLILSPFVLTYSSGDPALQQVVVGTAIAIIAWFRTASPRLKSWLSWANAALGAWLLVSASWFAESSTAALNEGVTGGFVLVLAVLSGSATDSARRAGEGGGVPGPRDRAGYQDPSAPAEPKGP